MSATLLWSTSTPLAPPSERTLSARRLRLAEACPRQVHRICAEWPWGRGYPRGTGPGEERRLCSAMVRELVRALLVEATRHPPGAPSADLLRGIGQWTVALPQAARSAVDGLLDGSRVSPDVVETLRAKAGGGEIAKEVRRMVGEIFKHVERSAPLCLGPAEPSDGRYVDIELGHEAQDGPWGERVDLDDVSGPETAALGRQLEARGTASRDAVGDARPRADTPRCGRCPVRQGCETWWSVERPREGAGPECIVDVEVEILPSTSSRVRAARVLAVSASVPGL